MQAEIDPKTNTMTLKFSVNPKSQEISGSGKSYMWASEVAKIDHDGKTIRVQVNVGTPVKPAKKK
jgi:hypothetical protein